MSSATSTARLTSGEMAAYGVHVHATRPGLPREPLASAVLVDEGGGPGLLARQARHVRPRDRLPRGPERDRGEDGEEEAERPAGARVSIWPWGKRRYL